MSICREEILEEVNRHVSDSVLSGKEKEVASLVYGIKNNYNPEGKRYTSEEIQEKFEKKQIIYIEKQDTNIKVEGAKYKFNYREVNYFKSYLQNLWISRKNP